MAALAINPGVYFISNVGTSTVIDLLNISPNPNGTVQGWTRDSYSNSEVSAQLWIIYPVDGTDNVYKIRNAGSRTYLDLIDGNPAPHTPIVGNPSSGADSQKWQILSNDNNTVAIQNVASGTFIDLYLGNDDDGTEINGWPGVPPINLHQSWRLQAAS